jgi:hypothetical protein
MEADEDWRGWIEKIPAVTFDPEWAVKVIPPFGGAMARFVVLSGPHRISVYLDVNESLGLWGGEPYWEAYPIADDVARFSLNDTDGLMAAIRAEVVE